MSRKILFFILILVGFSLSMHLEGTPKANGEAVTKQFHSSLLNPTLALFAEPIRGDANGDDEINGGDVVYLIVYLYKGGPPPPTLINGDANGDGIVNIADMVYLIHYLFRDGPPPPG